MEFKEYKKKFQENFKKMSESNLALFKVDVNPDLMWETYINSFPEELKQEYTCNACRSFIRHYGNIVVIDSSFFIHTIWDFEAPSVVFKTVNLRMSDLLYTCSVKDIFLSEFKVIGLDHNTVMSTSGAITWEHLCFDIPSRFVTTNTVKKIQEYRDSRNILKRSLEEITLDSVNTVLELICQGSLYRGEENKKSLQEFRKLLLRRRDIKSSRLELFYWKVVEETPFQVCRIRNTSIGTLLIDISEGEDLNIAVSKYNAIVAPLNYKRPTALVTSSMIKQAKEKVKQLGLEDSLPRRQATMEDITINNVVFANRNTKAKLTSSVFEELSNDTKVINPKSFSKVEEVNIDTFIKDILPTTTSLQVLLEDSKIPNLMTLTAPINKEAPSLFKWDNGFSWSYNGNATDSIKEKVKAAGGVVEGFIRCSLSWNNFDDLDLSIEDPMGNIVYYGYPKGSCGAELDVDMNAHSPYRSDCVENIIFKKAPVYTGTYVVRVTNYCRRESVQVGFEVEIEHNGEIYNFQSPTSPSNKNITIVAEFKYTKDGTVTVKGRDLKLNSSTKSKDIWGLKTNTFQEVTMIMNSPNYWDNNTVGNKHVFFILDSCQNPDPVRGFYNEYLRHELEPNRKVFELLGDKLKAPFSTQQLSGLGFSSTLRNSLICKVTGNTNRTIKIKF